MIWKKFKITVEQPFQRDWLGKGDKANFRRTTKWFPFENGQLHYKESRIVSKSMSIHLGTIPAPEKIAARFFWYGIYNDVTDYLQKM